jgi:MFS transporter, PAT family, beta-lactamase induction signal transducer AmpG
MNKWLLLASLYVAQFLPVAFFGQTIPVFLRQQGVSLELIGLTSLLSLPWMLKVLWSPLIDRYGWTKWGHYKFWIVLMQSLMGIAIALWTLPTLGFTSLPVLYLMAIGLHFSYSMTCIPMFAIAMDHSRQGNAGFDYTLQVTIIFIGSMLAGSFSGFIAKACGYLGAFAIAALLCLVGVLLVTTLDKESVS